MVAGQKYLIESISTDVVNVGYRVNGSSETVRIVSNLSPGSKYEFTAPVDAAIIGISMGSGYKIRISNLNDYVNRIRAIEDKLKIEDVSSVLHGGNNSVDIVAGTKYTFENTGTAVVGVYYVVPGTGYYRIGTGDLAVGAIIEWIAPINTSVINISAVSGAEITMSYKLIGSIEKRIEDLEVFADDFSVEETETDLNAGSNNYPLIAGQKYLFENTGTVGVNINYKVNAASSEVRIISDIQVGDSYEFVAVEDSSIITISNMSGVKVTVSTRTTGTLIGRIEKLEDEVFNKPILLRVASFNTGEYNGKNLPSGGDECVMAHRKLLAELNADIVGTQEDTSYYFGYFGANGGQYKMTNGSRYIITNTGQSAVNVSYKVNSESSEVSIVSDLAKNTSYTFDATEDSNYIVVSNVSGASISIRKSGDTIDDLFWKMFKYYERIGTRDYNYKAFASNYKINNIQPIYYTGDYDFRHTYFLAGEFFIGNKVIFVASFHFDWSDNDTRREEMRQIIAYASNYDYAILMGDTNTDNYVDGQPQEPHNIYYIEWPIFFEAGYNMANDGYFGLFDTVGYDYEPGRQSPLDNIFVKGNIVIRNVGTIVKDWTNDHCVIYADIAVY